MDSAQSRNGHRMARFEEILGPLPNRRAFGGEVLVLDDAGHPRRSTVRAPPSDLRGFRPSGCRRRRFAAAAFRERKARLARLGERAEGWIALPTACR
jgi:hypothetical protein